MLVYQFLYVIALETLMIYNKCDSALAIDTFTSQLRSCLEYNHNNFEGTTERNNLVMLLLSSTSREIDFESSNITAEPVYIGSFSDKQSYEYLTTISKVHKKWFSNKNFEKIRNGISNIPALLRLFDDFTFPPVSPDKDPSYANMNKLNNLVNNIEDTINRKYFSSNLFF